MFNFNLAEKVINKHTEDMEELQKNEEARENSEKLARLNEYRNFVDKKVKAFVDTANEVMKRLETDTSKNDSFFPTLSKDCVTFRFYSDVDVKLDDMGRTASRSLMFNGLKDFIENNTIQSIADILIERTPDFPTNSIDDYQTVVAEVLEKYNIRIRGFIYHKEYEETLDSNWRTLASDFHLCALYIDFLKYDKKTQKRTTLDLVQGLNTICFKNFDEFLSSNLGLSISRKIVQTRTVYFVNNRIIRTAER